MTHTPIILEVAFEPGKSIVIGNGERGIAIIPNDGGEREQERLDHAHRIAALWNMAERLGLTTEEIDGRKIENALYKLEELELMVERGDLNDPHTGKMVRRV